MPRIRLSVLLFIWCAVFPASGQAQPAPDNDNVSTPILVFPFPFGYEQNTISATKVLEDPFQPCTPWNLVLDPPATTSAESPTENTVWYRVDPTETGIVVANTFLSTALDPLNATYNTLMSAHSVSDLSLLACNDDYPEGFLGSQIAFNVSPGQPVFLHISGVTFIPGWEPGGNLQLQARLVHSIPGTALDPSGDTFGDGPDILEVNASTDLTDLIVSILFTGPVAPADSGQPNSLVGYIDLDTDQNPATGAPFPWLGKNSPDFAGLGPEFTVDLGSYTAESGTAEVQYSIGENIGKPAGLASVVFDTQSVANDRVTVTLPLSILGEESGILNTAVLVGSTNDPTSDIAPEEGNIETTLNIPSVSATVSDPAGDAFGGGPDIIKATATATPSVLTVSLDFLTPVTPAGSGGIDDLLGFIDLDTDQDSATGAAFPWDGLRLPDPTGIGPEYTVDLGTYDPVTGTADVLNALTRAPVGEATVIFSGLLVTVEVPLSVIGDDDGLMNIAILVGNPDFPVTDFVPDRGFLESSLGSAPVEADKNDKGYCFIATAAYGSLLEPEVVVLREFRDRFLLTHAPGRAFVRFYYRTSPPLAAFIEDHPLARGATRAALSPLVYGFKYPWVLAVVLAVSLLGFRLRRRRTAAN
ncbi:MAG TPA: CFI-box-CTERM domain-containing protein [Nitrospiria bacterium]